MEITPNTPKVNDVLVLCRGKGELVNRNVGSGLMGKVMSADVSHWEDSVLTMQ